MGGTALDVETHRLETQTFERAKGYIQAHLESVGVPAEDIYFVDYVREKQTHGDMDVLIRLEGKDRSVIEGRLTNRLDSRDVYTNGPTTSMDVPGHSLLTFQLDLIWIQPDHWEMAKIFHDWNDLGNLIGKVARYHRYKFGWQGLRLPYYYDIQKSEKLGEYVLTCDPAQALEFLGYDYERHREGFDTFEDMFEYAFSSMWAQYPCFVQSQLTAAQRHRDSKRDVYQRFLNWLKDREYEHLPRPGFRTALDRADDFFDVPIRDWIKENKNQLKRKKAASCVFNGGHIKRKLGLKGKEIGLVLDRMKERVTGEDSPYDTWPQYLFAAGRDSALSMADVVARDHPDVNY